MRLSPPRSPANTPESAELGAARPAVRCPSLKFCINRDRQTGSVTITAQRFPRGHPVTVCGRPVRGIGRSKPERHCILSGFRHRSPLAWADWEDSIPVREPRLIRWPTSACSSYVSGIRWTHWSMAGAKGVGTLMTNSGVTGRAHRDFVVYLSRPRCTVVSPKNTPVFTITNVWGAAGNSDPVRGSSCPS